MRAVLLMIAVLTTGCGAGLRSSIDLWRPHGRASGLDAGQRALLGRMTVETPSDDAIDAREHIDELGAVGDVDVRALLMSSLAWLDHLHRGGVIERLRHGLCSPSEVYEPPAPRSSGSTGDMIGDLATSGGWTTHGVEVPSLREDRHLALAVMWGRSEFADGECAHAYRALRALMVTRAWLGANVDDHGVLDVFRVVVEQMSGPPSEPCDINDGMAHRLAAIVTAIARHFHELDPREWRVAADEPQHPGCSIATLGGPLRGIIRVSPFLPARPPDEEPTPPPAESGDVIGALAREGFQLDLDESPAVRPGEEAYAVEVSWGAPGPVGMLFVARRGGEWRVIDALPFGQASD